MMATFTYTKTFEGNWEVLLRDTAIRSNLPRRLCLCTHEDDARVITFAMNLYHREKGEFKTIEKIHWKHCNVFYGNRDCNCGGDKTQIPLNQQYSAQDAWDNYEKNKIYPLYDKEVFFAGFYAACQHMETIKSSQQKTQELLLEMLKEFVAKDDGDERFAWNNEELFIKARSIIKAVEVQYAIT